MVRPFSRREAGLFFERLKKLNPTPKTELAHTNPFTLLIAVVLSAQATDKGVNKATERLFPIIQNPMEILELGEDRLIQYVRSIGLYRNKARNIMGLSRALVERFGGKVPKSRDELEFPAGRRPEDSQCGAERGFR